MMSESIYAAPQNRLWGLSEEERTRFINSLAVCCWFALATHASFILLFSYLGVWQMAWFNVGSVALFLSVLHLNKRGHVLACMSLIGLEVTTHALLAILFLGWDTGFHYYVITLSVMVYIHPWWSIQRKVVLVLPIFAAYILLDYYTRTHPGLYTLPAVLLQTLSAGNVAITICTLGLPVHFFSTKARQSEEGLVKANNALKALAETDSLTHLLNRRAMMEELSRQMARRQRHGMVFAAVLCDIDDFKSINDRYGHAAGDYVLQRVAELLRLTLREQDRTARWGGEEFLLLLPDTTLAQARPLAACLRQTVESERYEFKGQQLRVTLTCGVVAITSDESLERCLSRADKALYAGKHAGKNTVCVDEGCLTPHSAGAEMAHRSSTIPPPLPLPQR